MKLCMVVAASPRGIYRRVKIALKKELKDALDIADEHLYDGNVLGIVPGDTHPLTPRSVADRRLAVINGYAPLWTLVYFDVDSTPEGRLALRRLRRKMRSLWSSPSFKQQSYHLVPINADRLEH